MFILNFNDISIIQNVVFTKPLVVLMGPWSGGKSTMVNYILGNEYNKNAFKTGKKYNHHVNHMSTKNPEF